MQFLVLVVLALALATASAFETPVLFRDIPVNTENVGRIIGGTAVADGQIPYQVGLSLNGAWCGGSLISSTVILTAAHCVNGNKVGGRAYMGSATRTAGTSRSFAASAITRHASYNPSTVANDIALIRIQAVALSNNIKPIALPKRSSSYSTYVGNTVTISGWGKTSDSSGVSSRLMSARAVVISNADCAKTFGNVSVNSGTLCITTAAGTSTCNGDSGGPAVINGEQVGITSYGAAAGCTKGYPSAFSRVTHFRDWIYNNSGI